MKVLYSTVTLLGFLSAICKERNPYRTCVRYGAANTFVAKLGRWRLSVAMTKLTAGDPECFHCSKSRIDKTKLLEIE